MELALLLVVAVPFVVGLALWRRKAVHREVRAATVELRVDEFGVWRELADGREEGVDWVDLTEVEVYRTTTGPHGKGGGLLMLSGDEQHGCLVPLDRLDEPGLVEGLSRLPGFDLRLLHEAVESRAPNQLVVWRRGS